MIPLPLRAPVSLLWPRRLRRLSIVAILLCPAIAHAQDESAPDPEPRSLRLAAETRVLQDDAAPRPSSLPTPDLGLALPSRRSASFLAYSGRTWPLVLGAAADAATTSWALGRGADERNPLLSPGRLDVLMVKMIQLPLLMRALDAVEARHPRLGHQLRRASIVFNVLLAVSNVRAGRAAGRVPLAVRPVTLP
jgi:hypothetical protein